MSAEPEGLWQALHTPWPWLHAAVSSLNLTLGRLKPHLPECQAADLKPFSGHLFQPPSPPQTQLEGQEMEFGIPRPPLSPSPASLLRAGWPEMKQLGGLEGRWLQAKPRKGGGTGQTNYTVPSVRTSHGGEQEGVSSITTLTLNSYLSHRCASMG